MDFFWTISWYLVWFLTVNFLVTSVFIGSLYGNFFVDTHWLHLYLLQLEKALHDLQEEHVLIKKVSDSKLADAKALAAGNEEKSLEVEEKMRVAESKLAEVNMKSSELDMKLNQLEARENLLQRERLSFNTEYSILHFTLLLSFVYIKDDMWLLVLISLIFFRREAHKATFYKQREDLQEWEKKLRQGEESLCELRRTLNQREEKASEDERVLKKKERDLEEAEKKIDISFAKLKEREVDVNNRLLGLVTKEKVILNSFLSKLIANEFLHNLYILLFVPGSWFSEKHPRD